MSGQFSLNVTPKTTTYTKTSIHFYYHFNYKRAACFAISSFIFRPAKSTSGYNLGFCLISQIIGIDAYAVTPDHARLKGYKVPLVPAASNTSIVSTPKILKMIDNSFTNAMLRSRWLPMTFAASAILIDETGQYLPRLCQRKFHQPFSKTLRHFH